MRIQLVVLSALVAAPALAGTPVVVDREFLLQQLKVIQSQLSVAQQQVIDNPVAGRQLWTVQRNLSDLAHFVHDAQPVDAASFGPPPPPPPPPPPDQPQPIDDGSLAQVIAGINAESFSDAKVRVVRAAARGNWFTCAQVVQILNVLTFSNDKLSALSALAPRILDRQNAFAIYAAFTFDADKAKARKILGR